MEETQETAQPTLQKVCWEITRKQTRKKVEGETVTENRIVFKPKTLNGKYIKKDGADISMSALASRPQDEVKKLIQDKGYDTSNLTF